MRVFLYGLTGCFSLYEFFYLLLDLLLLFHDFVNLVLNLFLGQSLLFFRLLTLFRQFLSLLLQDFYAILNLGKLLKDILAIFENSFSASFLLLRR